MLKTANRVLDAIEHFMRVSLIVSLGGIAFLVNLAVFFRYVLSAPLSWTTELASYLLVYTVLFGATVALRRRQFVRIEALVDLIPFPLNRIISILSQFLVMGFLIACVLSPSALIEKAALTQTVSPALSIPMVYLYRLLRIGFSTMLLFLLFNTIDDLRAFSTAYAQKGQGR